MSNDPQIKLLTELLSKATVPEKTSKKISEGERVGDFIPEDYPTKDARADARDRANLGYPTVRTNHELDNILIGSTMKPGCIIESPWADRTMELPMLFDFGGTSVGMTAPYVPTRVKPVAAFLQYISKKYVPPGSSSKYTLSKKKGFSKQFGVSVEVKASVGVAIKVVDVSLEVTTGFEYSETIKEEVTETWEDNLSGPAEYWIYQPVILYAVAVPRVKMDVQGSTARLNLPKTTSVYSYNNIDYFFAPVFRDAPTTSVKSITPHSMTSVCEYLWNEAFNRW